MWMAGAGSVFVSLLLHLSVALGETTICAFKGSAVDLNCSITPVSSKKWFTANWNDQKQQYDNLQPVSGDTNRLVYNGSEESSSTLTIHDVNEGDVNTYLCLGDNDHSGLNPSSGISLRVADLQVHVSRHATDDVILTCVDNCTLKYNIYSLYKNNKELIQSGQNLSPSDDSYSCAVTGHDNFRSPAVCVNTDKKCWRVNYINREICALTNTSVEISSDYSYPSDVQEVTKAFWYIEWINGPEDIASDANYRDRFEYENTAKHHKLILKNLTNKDSAEYKFRFETDRIRDGKYAGDPGVILHITALTVTVSPATTVTEGQRVTLSCTTSCPLSGFSPIIYIWYQNNQFLKENQHNYVTLNPVLFSQHAGNYSCAVKDRESSRSPEMRYCPKTPLVSVSPSGEIEEGSSVTLTCSSDANPPVNKYVWYKKGSTSQKSLGQNYVMNISLEDGGEYYCAATNEEGTCYSTIQLITVTNKGTSRASIIVAAVIAVSCLFLFLLIYLGIRMRKYLMSVTEPRRGSVPGDPIQRGQRVSAPDRGNISATPTGPSSAEQTQTRGPQDDVNYSTVHFSRFKNQEVPQHSNDQMQRDEGDVQYAAVNLNQSSGSPGSSQGQATDVSDLYATVNKPPRV